MPDQRKSSRVATPAQRRRCEVRIGSTVLPALLLNESLGGFSVLVSGPPKIGANEKAQLSSYRGSFDVRIVHAREIVPATPVGDAANVQAAWAEEEDPGTVTTADIDGFPGPAQGPWFRLGIRCLREIAPPAPPAAPRSTDGRSLSGCPSAAS